jgi:hypothetical protein
LSNIEPPAQSFIKQILDMVRGQNLQRAVARRKAFLQRRFSLPALSRLLLGAAR